MGVSNNYHFQQLAKHFVLHEYIRIWKHLNNICTPHVTSCVAVPSFCRLGANIADLWPYKNTVSFFVKSVFTPSASFWGFFIELLCLVFANQVTFSYSHPEDLASLQESQSYTN